MKKYAKGTPKDLIDYQIEKGTYHPGTKMPIEYEKHCLFLIEWEEDDIKYSGYIHQKDAKNLLEECQKQLIGFNPCKVGFSFSVHMCNDSYLVV